MNNRIKTLLGLLAFVVLIGGAYFAYKNLSNLYTPNDQALLTQENNQALQEQLPGQNSITQNPAAQSPAGQSPAIQGNNTAQGGAAKSNTTQNNAFQNKTAQSNTAQNNTAQNNTASNNTAWNSITKAPGTQSAANQPAPKIENDTRPKATDFTVQNSGGKSVKLSNFFGKPIVVNFWASWCPPCRSEMPHFDKAYADYKGQVTFMMVDLVDGQRETISSGQDYIRNEGFKFPVYFDTQQSAAYAYRIQSIPTTLFIDSGGHIVNTVRGAMNESTLRSNIERIK